jgi:hypothetical protein
MRFSCLICAVVREAKSNTAPLYDRSLNDGRIDSPLQPLPFRIRPNPDAVLHKDFSMRKRRFGVALHFPAFEDRVIGALMKLFVSNLWLFSFSSG